MAALDELLKTTESSNSLDSLLKKTEPQSNLGSLLKESSTQEPPYSTSTQAMQKMNYLSNYLQEQIQKTWGMVDPQQHPILRNIARGALVPAGFLAAAPAMPQNIAKHPGETLAGLTGIPAIKQELSRYIPEINYASQDQIMKLVSMPKEQREVALATMMKHGQEQAKATASPMEALRSGETLENVLNVAAVVGGMRGALYEHAYPEVVDRVQNAGFKDMHDALQAMEHQPEDPRLNKLNHRDYEHLGKILVGEEEVKAEALREGGKKTIEEIQNSAQRLLPPPARSPWTEGEGFVTKAGEGPAFQTPEPTRALLFPGETEGKGFIMKEGETVPAEKLIEKKQPAAPLATPIKFYEGREAKAVIPGAEGMRVGIQRSIVDMKNLKARPPETQFRDRAEREAYRSKLENDYQNFEPSYTDISHLPGQGAPKVMPDGTPLSGAGLMANLKRMYDEAQKGTPKGIENLKKYNEEVLYPTKENHGIGLNREEIDAMQKRGERPIRVEKITDKLTPEEQIKFARIMDEHKPQAELSDTEKAMSHASIMTPELAKAPLIDFINKLSPGERTRLVDAKGNLLPAAEALKDRAMMAKLFGDKHTMERMLENPGMSMQARKFIGAAPELIDALEKNPARAPEFRKAFSETLRDMSVAIEEGKSIKNHLKETHLFPGDPEMEGTVRHLMSVLNDTDLTTGTNMLKDLGVYIRREGTEQELITMTKPSLLEAVKGWLPLGDERGSAKIPFGPEDPIERKKRVMDAIRKERENLRANLKPEQVPPEMKKADDKKIENEKVVAKEDADYQKDIQEDPQMVLKDAEGKPIISLKDHPLIKVDPLEKATMPSDIWGTTMIFGDSLQILGRNIPMELVRVDRKIIPRAIRILNTITTDIADLKKQAYKKLSKAELSDIGLALENLKFNGVEIVKDMNAKEELAKDPFKKKILDAFDKGYAWARTKEGFNAPMIAGQEGYMHHMLKQAGYNLNDVRSGRAIGNDVTLEALKLEEDFRKMRKGAPGWELDPFKPWDLYVKQGMRRKYMKPALDRTDAMAKALFEDQPLRMKYYNNLKDTAIGLPYTVDKAIQTIGSKNINALRGADILAAAQYVGTIGMNLATAVKHMSPILYTGAEHPIYMARAMGMMAREVFRMGPESWIKGDGFLDKKASPALRNPLIYQSVENFYNMADSAISRAPKQLQQLMFSPITFSEYIKRGLNFHVGLLTELDKGTPLKTAYGKATQFALERGLPMGKLLRNEFVRNFIPRAGLMFTQPPAATLNMLWRMAKENPKGLAKIATVMGGILAWQTVKNRDGILSNIGLFGKQATLEGKSKWDLFGRYSPIAQALEVIHPSMTTVEFVKIMDDLRKAKNPKQRTAVLESAGLFAAQIMGFPIPPSSVEGVSHGGQMFVPMGPRDMFQFKKLLGRNDLNPNDLLLELFRVKTRPKYWYK